VHTASSATNPPAIRLWCARGPPRGCVTHAAADAYAIYVPQIRNTSPIALLIAVRDDPGDRTDAGVLPQSRLGQKADLFATVIQLEGRTRPDRKLLDR
jgi:hypothetical protein